ncbi:MAG: hypothetical protein KDA44_13980 [Planctomycetales bacterium]|nr:hypothetical protein [Planctomycetales bacterium]
MKFRAWGIAALALCVIAAGAAPGRAQTRKVKNVDYQVAEYQPTDDDVDQASYQSVSSVGFGSGGAGGAAIGSAMGGIMDRPIQIVAGAQYLYARANFSQALAYVDQDLINGGENFVQYAFDYNSSYGFYGGVYLCDCGGSILFNYNRLTSGASFAANSVTGQNNIYGPFEIDGDITGFADVDLRSYDLSFSKTIPLGCPMTCGSCCDDACCDTCCEDTCCDDPCCGDSCGNGCGCCGCPAWDITWSGGIRYAEVGWGRGASAYDYTTTIPTFIDGYTTRMDFNGFGGRIGLAGRRYFGKRGLFSLYAKGDWSLLVGQIDIETLVTDAASSSTAFARTSCDHIVPVTEIELGGTVHLGCHASVSAGYFWSAWHDLGMREEYDFNQFQTSHYDDANILGFDGLFVRGEVAF